jgi:DmsE family decaheme c-type cytochrome
MNKKSIGKSIGKSNGTLFSARVTVVLAMLLFFALSMPALAAGGDEATVSGEYSKGAKQCLSCHKEGKDLPAHEIFQTPMGSTGDPDSPFAAGKHECETCHGPSKDHMKKLADGTRPSPAITFDHETPVEDSNAVCLSCHADGARFHWPGSTHDAEAVACVDCHDVHAANDPVLALETQPAVCANCHQEQRAQFLRQSHHPVQGATESTSYTGLMSCSDCHMPHGSTGPALLTQSTINETCYQCHAEKRGPFLWEHAPVQEDCTNCHTPHGSNYDYLQKARQPWMCQQCHLASRHPSGVYSGTGIPPVGAAQQELGKECLSCHSQIHGSNHPSGIRFTR